jgi:hypothetical protein
MYKMSAKNLIGGSGAVGSGIFTLFAIAVIMYSMWFFSGGPQRTSSNNAFIKGPTHDNPYNMKTYGTIPSVDRVNREINP